MMNWIRDHLWWSTLGAFVLLVFGFFWYSLGPVWTTNPLYNQLIAVMEERNRLWLSPELEGGGTGLNFSNRDISDIVCPLVTKEALNEMYNNPNIARSMEYLFLEDWQVHPDNSQRWTITKTTGFLATQTLDVTLGPDGYCDGFFQRFVFMS